MVQVVRRLSSDGVISTFWGEMMLSLKLLEVTIFIVFLDFQKLKYKNFLFTTLNMPSWMHPAKHDLKKFVSQELACLLYAASKEALMSSDPIVEILRVQLCDLQ